MLQGKIATVFGGTGFIGRYVIQSLAREGYTIRVPTRFTADAGYLRTYGVVGQINPIALSLHDHASIIKAVEGSDIVVNLLGALAPTRRESFEFLQAEVPGRIARAAAATGARAMVHISAIGADKASKSAYAASKAHGEDLVRAAFPQATILRPSIVFGPEDEFFNRFAAMAQIAPALPLIGGGKTRFQPVYVADVAEAVAACVKNGEAAGKTYDLAGPEIYTFRQLMELMLGMIGLKRMLVSIPFGIAEIQGRLLELLPGKLLTRDQVTLLKRDNVAEPGMPGLNDLGITPTALEIVLPSYMDRFCKGGRFHGGAHGEKLYS
jgi:NADH dehydrogenase